MDDIEIVIKISEKEYNGIKKDNSGMFGGHIYQAIKNGRPLSEYCPVIHRKKPMTKEDIDDYIRRSDIGLTDFEIVMCNGNYKEALKMLLTKIEKAPPVMPKSAWIPVSEGYPIIGVDVLVCTSTGCIYTSCLDWRGEWYFSEYWNARIDNVVAWMPMPEPYKPESEDKK